ncbi:ladinin-1 isoform X1 [Takifugu rubripes]|uniref:ladinin-1 isoform X1 n=1 Tax=Takifugu rubripes TaxID=31033 RepID=UPI001145F180|nr:ladinin-1 isoform X1 [Takifugu rubripes]
MSISRKNWSALSSLTRQWTMEDEEEVERERRRKVRGSSSTADPEDDFRASPSDMPTSDSRPGTHPVHETSQVLSSDEQVQLDFIEMLRVRDEKRRMRQVEALRRQKELEDEEAAGSVRRDSGRKRGGGGASVDMMEDQEDREEVFSPPKVAPRPRSPKKAALYSESSSTSSDNFASDRQHENRESTRRDPEPTPSSNQSRKFVSSVSISLDKGTSGSGRVTPTSPRSSTSPLTPEEYWQSPCQSPSPRALSPVQNGHTQNGNGCSTDGNFEQATKPAFVRQSSRTISFRMMRKKEEEAAPLQRSKSVRMTSKKFESNTEQNEEAEVSNFQRNSRQRISSRSIQEKMERLAQAAQKSEVVRFPDVTQRTLLLFDEVSRKRELFEKESQTGSTSSSGGSRQEFLGFTAGVSDRINRWLSKTKQPASSHIPVDLRHVDISSKRTLFEKCAEDGVSKTSTGKFK